MPDSAAVRQQRRRDRLSGKLPPYKQLLCECGNGRSGRYGMQCRDCWLQSPEGRQWQRERIASWRTNKRNKTQNSADVTRRDS